MTWVADLAALFPAVQFIVTAHSPLVVQAAAERAKLAVLRRDPETGGATIHNDLGAVHGWRVDQILTSDLFGLEGARTPRVNELLAQRGRLLRKASLDEHDSAELARLDAELDALPHGESPEQREAWDLVRRFASAVAEEGASE